MIKSVDSANRRWLTLVKAVIVCALGFALILMLPVITPERATNVARGEATREMIEITGLNIADEAAKSWNTAAELVEIDGWKTVLTEYQDGTFDLLLTGWQYYYRAGGAYLKVSVDVDSYDRGTVSSTEEPTQTEIQFIERIGVRPLSEWIISGPIAVDIASGDYEWSLESGDDLAALYLLMPDIGADSIPVWYVSIRSGSSGVETDYLIDANDGGIITSSDGDGAGVKQITEYAGLDIADDEAHGWNSGAQLIRVENWKTSVIQTVASDSSELLTTGWQYYYLAGDSYYTVKLDADSLDSDTYSSALEMTRAGAESVGLVGLEALSEWNIPGPSAIEKAADEYDMSLERDDELSGLYLEMAEVDGDSLPVWYVSITNGETDSATGYEINAVTGEIIVRTGDALVAVAISVSIIAVLTVVTGGMLVRRYYSRRRRPVGEEVIEEVVPVSPPSQPSVEDTTGAPLGEAVAAPVAPPEQPAVEDVQQPPVEEAVEEPVVTPEQPAVEKVLEPSVVEAPPAPPAGEPPDVFVSHVEEDAETALEIALGLEEAGYSTWCYEVDILPGLYLTQVEHAIGCCPVFLLVISPDSLGSTEVTNELVRAYQDEKVKHFIPVLRDITDVEYKRRKPMWWQCLGASTSFAIPPEGISRLIPRITGGLKAMGIHPRGEPDASRLIRIREELDSLRRKKKLD